MNDTSLGIFTAAVGGAIGGVVIVGLYLLLYLEFPTEPLAVYEPLVIGSIVGAVAGAGYSYLRWKSTHGGVTMNSIIASAYVASVALGMASAVGGIFSSLADYPEAASALYTVGAVLLLVAVAIAGVGALLLRRGRSGGVELEGDA